MAPASALLEQFMCTGPLLTECGEHGAASGLKSSIHEPSPKVTPAAQIESMSPQRSPHGGTTIMVLGSSANSAGMVLAVKVVRPSHFKKVFQMIPVAVPFRAKLTKGLWPLALSGFLSTGVQASSCISAGRMDAGAWAPQLASVRLLDGAGRPVSVKSKSELTRVRGVELTENALLSTCQGDQPLARGQDAAAPKGPVPAAKPGRLAVVSVGFSKLQTGGEWVELEVVVAADQTVMVTR